MGTIKIKKVNVGAIKNKIDYVGTIKNLLDYSTKLSYIKIVIFTAFWWF